MRPFAIAGLQLKVSGRRSNLEHITDRIEMLMHLYPWVQMVVVSELATFGGWTGHAAPLPGETEEHYQRLAARHEIWLLPGSLYEQTEQGIYNTTPVIDPSGAVIARYRKMFPFMPYETGVEWGTEFCVFDIPNVGRFGVSICYDMWFPETTRTLASMGAEVLLHPTLTPTMDRDVELAIARATAAINQMFVVDINGIGDGGNGRSLFVAPTGDVLYQAGSNEELLPIEIDLDRVRRSREVGLKGLGQPLKSFRDRRVDFDVYNRGSPTTAYLETLGSLEKMSRGSRAGIAFGQHHPHSLPPIPTPAPGQHPGQAPTPPPPAAQPPMQPPAPPAPSNHPADPAHQPGGHTT
jgi:predicted amidohydrolase